MKWYHSIVFLWTKQIWLSEAGKDRWEWAVVVGRTRTICRNLGHEDIQVVFFFLWISSVSLCLLSICFKLSLKPEQTLTEIWDRHDSPVIQIKNQTWEREWEHLGGGKYDESQSQLVPAYATLNNAPFQMVNLLNPRLPLAPHLQHARKAPGREHKDSSQAAMTEERPQQSGLLSVSPADALYMSILQYDYI